MVIAIATSSMMNPRAITVHAVTRSAACKGFVMATKGRVCIQIKPFRTTGCLSVARRRVSLAMMRTIFCACAGLVLLGGEPTLLILSDQKRRDVIRRGCQERHTSIPDAIGSRARRPDLAVDSLSNASDRQKPAPRSERPFIKRHGNANSLLWSASFSRPFISHTM